MNIIAFFVKGNHRHNLFFIDWLANIFPILLLKKNTTICFKLDKYCWYDDPQEPGQINKLAGYSSLFIHRNSWRLGWKPDPCDKSSFLLYTYIYKNGEREEKYLKRLSFDKWHSYVVDRKDLPKGLLWRCIPFIGGKLACPNTCMEIQVLYED